jgi:exopolysaccharide biosynthesis predicted pyruvyltransferase EpsI
MPATGENIPSKVPRPPDRLDLEGFLAELKHESQPILFIPNPGNAGDALIAHATRQLFDRLGLDYVWVNDFRGLDPLGRVVVYGGGGNLVSLYPEASRALRWADGRAKRLVLLPHTISGHEGLLADLGPETDLICRELVSFDHVRGAVRSARCHLADDIVFMIDTNAILATLPAPMSTLPLYGRRLLYRMMLKPSWSKSVASPRKLRRSEKLFATRRAELAHGGAAKVLHAFRTDAEQTGVRIPADNLDLSTLMYFGTRDARVCHTGAQHLLRYIDMFDEVRTNRLHLAIGAAVLGKRVKLHSNSYFKNRAVYEFSILDRFPDVEWVEVA